MRELNYEFDEESLDKMCVLLYAGLVHEDEELTLSGVGKMMRFDLMPYCIEKLAAAISGSLPQPKNEKSQSKK